MNERLVNSIKKHEGFVPKFYRDSLDFWTVGYGTRMNEVEVSKELATEWLMKELEEKYEQLRYVQGFELLSDVRKDVLLEMAYQMGVSGVMKFQKMWAAIRGERWERAADEMLDSRWAKSQTPKRAAVLAWRFRHDRWSEEDTT